mgnify:CR=1 FL=1|tara:strand:- start:6370 stop:7497 length:1128 start_codon:yes stop_codon:yes gene_type:complete
MKDKKNIFIIAGESSGDQHAANYIYEHLNVNPNLSFAAFGQAEIKKTPAKLIYDTEKISVIGIVEVISKYKEISNALNLAKGYIKDNKPDLIVLVDYIEFNLKIARYAKQFNIPILFYIAPQAWAWREKRAQGFMNSISHLAVIFPFEEKFFKKYSNNVSYVGHPLGKRKDLKNNIKNYKERTIDLGIFPGSRESEIKNNIHTMLDCVQNNKNEIIRIFYANQTSKDLLIKLLPNSYHEYLVSGKDIENISNCKKALCASGTITLELAMLNVPMIIVYKLSYISFLIMKGLVKVKYIGLVNLILGNEMGSQPIINEYIQPSYSDQVDIMVELNKIDIDQVYRNNMISNYEKLRHELSTKSTRNIASIADSFLKPT